MLKLLLATAIILSSTMSFARESDPGVGFCLPGWERLPVYAWSSKHNKMIFVGFKCVNESIEQTEENFENIDLDHNSAN